MKTPPLPEEGGDFGKLQALHGVVTKCHKISHSVSDCMTNYPQNAQNPVGTQFAIP